MPSEYQLVQSSSAVADANGTASVALSPSRAFEAWHVTSVSIQSNSSDLTPELREYKNSVSDTTLTGSSRSGDLDSGNSNLDIMPGESLIYVWTNCDVGARCSVIIQGKSTKP